VVDSDAFERVFGLLQAGGKLCKSPAGRIKTG
jgi:hypothetical protein